MQLDLKNAQIVVNEKGDRSVWVRDPHGEIEIVFHREYAKRLQQEYEEQLKTGAGKWDMRVQVNIQIKEPTGKLG